MFREKIRIPISESGREHPQRACCVQTNPKKKSQIQIEVKQWCFLEAESRNSFEAVKYFGPARLPIVGKSIGIPEKPLLADEIEFHFDTKLIG